MLCDSIAVRNVTRNNLSGNDDNTCAWKGWHITLEVRSPPLSEIKWCDLGIATPDRTRHVKGRCCQWCNLLLSHDILYRLS